MSFISMHFPSFPDVPSPAWATSPASLASSASLAGADADDAGDVAQEVLRMQKRPRGNRTPNVFTAVFRAAEDGCGRWVCLCCCLLVLGVLVVSSTPFLVSYLRVNGGLAISQRPRGSKSPTFICTSVLQKSHLPFAELGSCGADPALLICCCPSGQTHVLLHSLLVNA